MGWKNGVDSVTAGSGLLALEAVHFDHSFANAMGHAGDERVAHAESSMAVGHTSIRPALGESLELIELVGNEAAETAVGALDNMLKSAGARAAFAREDGAARFVGGIRETHGTLGIRVRKARLFVGAFFALAALEVAPVGKLLVGDVELLRNILLINKYIAKHTALAVIILNEVAGQNMAALHDTGILELRCLLTNAKTSRVLVRIRQDIELGIAPEGESAPKDFGSKKYKGGMGTLIEERYFGYKANSDDRPDFPEAGVELKATCFDVLKDGRKSAGERLVLTMIPYDRPVSLDYDSSHLKTKLSNILLIYYGRDRSIDKYDQRIERAVMVCLPEEDMKIIRADYEKIISYIQDGRADELSEGMTTYLGACTKGATEATMWVDQYYEYFNTDTGEIEHRRAKRRAFSLKRSYMDYVLHTYVLGAPRVGESIVQDDGKSIDFESYVTGLIERHYGETDRQIAEQYGLEYTGNKAQWTTLVYRMLGIKNSAAEEFVKAGISVRTVRVNNRGHIEQAMSFPPFEFKRLIEEDWETSPFHACLETNRFFFVVFREDHDGVLRLDRCLFWAMGENEIEGPAKACWDETRKVIREGVELNPYRDASGKLKVTNNLPGMADNPIVHVRPHTSKAAYKFADGTEIGDIARNAYELPDGRWMTKQSFWFNKGYLEHILGL